MTDDSDPPKLTIAARNDEPTLQRQRALDEITWPTRELVANLLRVMRGAGRPIDLPNQVLDLAVAIQEAGQIANAWYIGNAIEEAMKGALPDAWSGSNVEGAQHTICRGVLQLLASKLVNQSSQASAGEREMRAGIDELEKAWEASRKKMRDEWAQFQQSAPKKRLRKAMAERALAIAGGNAEPEKKLTTAAAMRRRRRDIEKGG